MDSSCIQAYEALASLEMQRCLSVFITDDNNNNGPLITGVTKKKLVNFMMKQLIILDQ